MQQQAAIILALSTRPDYLLLDECFDGLDPLKRSLLRRLLSEIMAEKQISVMISSHHIRELEDLCDSVGVINNHRIIYDSSVDEMRENINKYRVAFKQEPAADALDGFSPKNLVTEGRVATFVAYGPPHAIEAQLKQMSPALIQIVPLTLEEIFLVEMEEKNDDFTGIL